MIVTLIKPSDPALKNLWSSWNAATAQTDVEWVLFSHIRVSAWVSNIYEKDFSKFILQANIDITFVVPSWDPENNRWLL